MTQRFQRGVKGIYQGILQTEGDTHDKVRFKAFPCIDCFRNIGNLEIPVVLHPEQRGHAPFHFAFHNLVQGSFGVLVPRRRLCRWARPGILPPDGGNNRGFPAGSAVRFPVLMHGEAGVLPASRSGKNTFINAIKSHISSVFKQYITHD